MGGASRGRQGNLVAGLESWRRDLLFLAKLRAGLPLLVKMAPAPRPPRSPPLTAQSASPLPPATFSSNFKVTFFTFSQQDASSAMESICTTTRHTQHADDMIAACRKRRNSLSGQFSSFLGNSVNTCFFVKLNLLAGLSFLHNS